MLIHRITHPRKDVTTIKYFLAIITISSVPHQANSTFVYTPCIVQIRS